MTTIANPVPEQDLSGITGKHFIYTYANGWQYEMYVKNARTIDYRIHTGMVGGRWVKNQTVDLVRLDSDIYKISWTEPTGTSVSVNVLPTKRRLHGVIFFPHWVHQHPERTVCFQNDHLDQMANYRDQGPTYPICVVPEFAKITFLEDCGENNEAVITTAPADLPQGYADRIN
ncbi:phenolic acid decarboxylase [Streptomyces sp. bgisy100]|uniref:phenolic acid decarboxylase n=1 Tax=Streptomyces sp. bgisy100 TaxID=3413783 RepID=UPI003D738E6F